MAESQAEEELVKKRKSTSVAVFVGDSSPTRELNLETRDLTWTRALNDSDSTRTRALGTRELKRGLDFFKCH